MYNKFKKQIEELMALGIGDIKQLGDVSIRGTIVYADGKETMFPPPGTNGVLLNLHKDSARMAHKKIMRHRIAVESDIEAIFLLHYRVIYELADLVKHPNRFSLYVLGMTAEESIFVRQDYTLDDSKNLVFGELTVLENDPEDEFLVHGYLAEKAITAISMGFSPEVAFQVKNDDFIFEKVCKPKSPLYLPKPLFLMPPKGNAGLASVSI